MRTCMCVYMCMGMRTCVCRNAFAQDEAERWYEQSALMGEAEAVQEAAKREFDRCGAARLREIQAVERCGEVERFLFMQRTCELWL